jgi:hypothetical protein
MSAKGQETMMKTIGVATALLLFAGGATPSAEIAKDTSPTDVTGIWNIDRSRSDDLAAQLEGLREQMKDRRGGGRPSDARGRRGGGMGCPVGRGRMGGMGGMGGGMRRGGAGSAGHEGGAGMPEPRDLAQAWSQLLIVRSDDALAITDGAEVTRHWDPDGEIYSERTPRAERTRRAWFDGDILVLESAGDGPRMTRRLSVAPDRSRLTVDYELQLPGDRTLRGRLTYRGV